MEKVKEELRSYHEELKYVQKLENEIEALRTLAEATTKEISDMPSGGGSTIQDKMAECVAEIVDLMNEKSERTIEMLHKLKRIENVIDCMPQPYKNILYSAYIEGKSLTEVAVEQGLDYIYFCRKKHKKALILYKKIKEDIERQLSNGI